jgi:signal transduction histidine kinase
MSLDTVNGNARENPNVAAEIGALELARVAYLYYQGIWGIRGSLVAAVILTISLWDATPHLLLLAWLICYTTACGAGEALFRGYRKASDLEKRAGVWGRRFTALSVIGGILWGVTPLILFPTNSIFHQAFLTFVLGGMSIGITISHGAVAEAHLPFILAVYIPLIGRYFYEGDKIHITMGALLLIFMLYLIGAARRMLATVTESLNLRFQNQALIEVLRQEKAASDNLNEILRSEVRERKQAQEAVQRTTQDLEFANQELKDFAYIVSHDLKAPLRAARQLLGWLAADYGHLFEQEGKDHLDLLMNRVGHMHNLIDSILHYSSLGRIREEQTEVDLNQVVSEVIEMVGPLPHISITVESKLPTIICEKTRIQELFQNLLDNAIKYSDKPEGLIKVGCTREDSHWKFSVSDNGPGIDEKYHEKIFQIFQTLHSRSEVESTGIGLTVVKKIVELHGGKVWVESQLRSGATFFFTLPNAGGE